MALEIYFLRIEHINAGFVHVQRLVRKYCDDHFHIIDSDRDFKCLLADTQINIQDDAYVGSKRACIFHINNVVTRIL